MEGDLIYTRVENRVAVLFILTRDKKSKKHTTSHCNLKVAFSLNILCVHRREHTAQENLGDKQAWDFFPAALAIKKLGSASRFRRLVFLSLSPSPLGNLISNSNLPHARSPLRAHKPFANSNDRRHNHIRAI
jgi:hypothetical protein